MRAIPSVRLSASYGALCFGARYSLGSVFCAPLEKRIFGAAEQPLTSAGPRRTPSFLNPCVFIFCIF